MNNRARGIRGELEACKLWRPYFPEVRRSFGQARMGFEQPDLIGSMIERSFFVEVKRTKKPPNFNLIGKWEKKLFEDFGNYVELGGEKSEYLLLMWRADHHEWQTLLLRIDKLPIRASWENFEVMLNDRLKIF